MLEKYNDIVSDIIVILNLKFVFVCLYFICKSKRKWSVLLNTILDQMYELRDQHKAR